VAEIKYKITYYYPNDEIKEEYIYAENIREADRKVKNIYGADKIVIETYVESTEPLF